MLLKCLMVGLGGFVGSVFRYLIGLIPFLNKWEFPVHTLIINLMGAIFIGVIMKTSGAYGVLSEHMMLFLKIGICGGFTTFSTFSLEALELIEGGKLFMAGVYILLSVILCLAGVYFGKQIVELY